MTRNDLISRALKITGKRGRPPVSVGAALESLCRAAIIDDPEEDPIAVIRGVFKNLRGAMAELNEELKGIES